MKVIFEDFNPWDLAQVTKIMRWYPKLFEELEIPSIGETNCIAPKVSISSPYGLNVIEAYCTPFKRKLVKEKYERFEDEYTDLNGKILEEYNSVSIVGKRKDPTERIEQDVYFVKDVCSEIYDEEDRFNLLITKLFKK
jgi:hypothetical protein